MNALSELEKQIRGLQKKNDDLVVKHGVEIAHKDEEYVELLIKLGEKEEELALVRAELRDTKEELKIVSCKLIQTQHEQYEEAQTRNQWMPLFGSCFSTF